MVQTQETTSAPPVDINTAVAAVEAAAAAWIESPTPKNKSALDAANLEVLNQRAIAKASAEKTERERVAFAEIETERQAAKDKRHAELEAFAAGMAVRARDEIAAELSLEAEAVGAKLAASYRSMLEAIGEASDWHAAFEARTNAALAGVDRGAMFAAVRYATFEDLRTRIRGVVARHLVGIEGKPGAWLPDSETKPVEAPAPRADRTIAERVLEELTRGPKPRDWLRARLDSKTVDMYEAEFTAAIGNLVSCGQIAPSSIRQGDIEIDGYSLTPAGARAVIGDRILAELASGPLTPGFLGGMAVLSVTESALAALVSEGRVRETVIATGQHEDGDSGLRSGFELAVDPPEAA